MDQKFQMEIVFFVFYIHSSQPIAALDVMQVAGGGGRCFFFVIAKSVEFGKQHTVGYSGVQAGAPPQAVGAIGNKIVVAPLPDMRHLVERCVAYVLPLLGQ